MRALCGAIITAGALVGLGLTALAYGVRYHTFGPEMINPTTDQLYAAPSLVLMLVLLILGLLIGLGIAFLGLAFHHERRHREVLRGQRHPAAPDLRPATPAPASEVKAPVGTP